MTLGIPTSIQPVTISAIAPALIRHGVGEAWDRLPAVDSTLVEYDEREGELIHRRISFVYFFGALVMKPDDRLVIRERFA
jgi:hypothetical protein